MPQTNIESIINSAEYKCKLSEHLTALLRRTRSAKTEASIAFAFNSEIYTFVKNVFHIELPINQETGQTSLRHKFAGRMDSVCNNLVIEYKKPGKLKSETDKQKALAQLTVYLEQLLQEEETEYQGVLTDGVKIKYVYFQASKIHSTHSET